MRRRREGLSAFYSDWFAAMLVTRRLTLLDGVVTTLPGRSVVRFGRFAGGSVRPTSWLGKAVELVGVRVPTLTPTTLAPSHPVSTAFGRGARSVERRQGGHGSGDRSVSRFPV